MGAVATALMSAVMGISGKLVTQIATALMSAVLGIIEKLATQEFVEFMVIRAAEIWAKRTPPTYDDEVVAKIKEILDRK